MDNNENKSEKRPAPKRKKVSKKVIRQRQLCALAVIALIILVLFILLAKSCSNGGNGEEESDASATTTTTSVMTTTTEPTTTTTVATTTNPLASNVQLDKRELFVNVGDDSSGIYARILSYPDENTGEANEVWKSMDESIATVNSWGAVTGVSEGETFIILSFDNHPDIEIEIKVHVASGGAVMTGEATPEITTIAGITPEYTPEMPTTPVYGYTDGSEGGEDYGF
ncbi:MAG: hypothetical protein NC340_02060 [Ruminococcus flavefaciens]|nr:hypothetical protein [Ruminococcus flavefaciens]MCM1228931.1 hypothetical protein [Ruminococcus flavefaciens]